MTTPWVELWFSSQAALTGGVVRRRINHVEEYASLGEVEHEARQRDWHVVVIGEQVIVLCNEGVMRVIC